MSALSSTVHGGPRPRVVGTSSVACARRAPMGSVVPGTVLVPGLARQLWYRGMKDPCRENLEALKWLHSTSYFFGYLPIPDTSYLLGTCTGTCTCTSIRIYSFCLDRHHAYWYNIVNYPVVQALLLGDSDEPPLKMILNRNLRNSTEVLLSNNIRKSQNKNDIDDVRPLGITFSLARINKSLTFRLNIFNWQNYRKTQQYGD
jgi:hypothetical protein